MDPTRTLEASDGDDGGLELVEARYLVLALDCARPLSPPVRLHLDAPVVTIGRGSHRAWCREGASAGGEPTLRIELADGWMSSGHARLVRGPGERWILEDRGSKNGTFLNGARVETAELRDEDRIEVGNTTLLFRVARHTGRPSDLALSERALSGVPRTLHPAWSVALGTLLRVARSNVPVLVLGDTGTGKEVLVRAVHTASGRAGPLCALNCGAIARTLIESELFGVRKGAFSGATEDRPGLVRAADGGTLFLDEIAELPEPSQVALLRVLQEQEVLAVGATRAVRVDVRVIAATAADLAARVGQGSFRADLYARLSGHITRVPALRERREDVGVLVAELLQRLAADRAERVALTRAAGRALIAYDWPFNVRELEHALQAALAIAECDEISLSHLPEAVRGGPRSEGALPPRDTAPADTPELDAERERIVRALEACAGNQTQAARALGISRATLVNKLAVHRLPRPRKRGG